MINDPKRIHFVGIKGVAMAALALYWQKRGAIISGSDTSEQFPTDAELLDAGITIQTGFSEAHITQANPDLVIYTGAHGGKDNIEVVTAVRCGIAVMPQGKALGDVMAGTRQISVAGSHGKTTTSAMIATILSTAGLKPSYAIGCGEIFHLGPAGRHDTGEFFVAEADEYVTDPGHDLTPRFLWQRPEVLVVTNIDYDHPDVYESVTAVQDAFVKLIAQQEGKKITVLNADDSQSQMLRSHAASFLTYGFSEGADIRIVSFEGSGGQTLCTIKQKDKTISVVLRIPGKHNISNAAAAASACRAIGISWEQIISGLAAFCGTKRRFEHLGEISGIQYYDDYAHHPREIRATLAAARLWYPNKRIIVVFQPHTYSRTEALLEDFAKAFLDANHVILTDIYASAREAQSPGKDGTILLKAMKEHHGQVTYAKDPAAVLEVLGKQVQSGDVVIFMGAGDIYHWEKDVIGDLKG